MNLPLLKSFWSRLVAIVKAAIRFVVPETQPIKVRILQRDPFRITVSEWRTNEELCMTAHKVLRDPNVRRMLDTLRNAQLAFTGMCSTDVTMSKEQRIVHFLRCEGYGMALNDFESLEVHRKQQEPIEATFGTDIETEE